MHNRMSSIDGSMEVAELVAAVELDILFFC
jgi:hypothetical protein